MRTLIPCRKYVLAGAAALAALASMGTAHAADVTVLYAFRGGKDGARPLAGLIKDKTGNLYGTTYGGGGRGCRGYGCGTVFKIAPDGTETVLYAFAGESDGAEPEAGLIEDRSGDLYGTTYSGGGGGGPGWGTVFKLTPDGAETVLHSFYLGYGDGAKPLGGLTQDKAGNLYGTTKYGGALADFGTVFKIAPNGAETILHAFTGAPDGAEPVAGLILDKAGDLYGTTSVGGANNGWGTVFKFAPDGTETVLYAFGGGPDGSYPSAALTRDKAGNLYGTTLYGGTDNNFGTVFKLAPDGTKTVLHAFGGGSDGAYPEAGLIRDKAGNLYGTTKQGGGTGCHFHYGCGTVFKLAPNGVETVLYSFHGRKDGTLPCAELQGRDGWLYGTASEGGGTDCKHGCGTIFRLKE